MEHNAPTASLLMIQNWEELIDRPDGCAAIQRDLNRLEKYVNRNFVKCNEWKYKVLNVERNNPMDQHRLGAD